MKDLISDDVEASKDPSQMESILGGVNTRRRQSFCPVNDPLGIPLLPTVFAEKLVVQQIPGMPADVPLAEHVVDEFGVPVPHQPKKSVEVRHLVGLASVTILRLALSANIAYSDAS
jgi:hypothetical protein